MVEKIFARQLDNGLWQWRPRENNEWLSQSYFTGDGEALLTSLEGRQDVPVCLLLRGASCISREEVAEVNNKRTLTRMLPYELEDDIIDPIDELHFSFGEIDEQKITLLYTRADSLENAIAKLSEADCDVRECVPDYLLLEKASDELIVVWDHDQVLAHFGRNQGFAVQADIAQLYLKQLDLPEDSINKVTLVAENPEQCEELISWLSPALATCQGITTREGAYWDCIDAEASASPLNLRSGRFARQLPFQQWWLSWKKPAYFAAAALLLAVVVNYAMYFDAKKEYQDILDTRKTVFLQAVPNGRWQTPERELKSRLGGDKGGAGPSNFMYLFEGVAKVLENKNDISLGSLRYNGDQKELVISFEVGNFAEIEAVRTQLESQGLKAETLRAAAQGDSFQARMKIAQNAGVAS